MNTQTAKLTTENLSQFWGSENLYFNWLFRAIKYTEGVQFVSANGAGWLVDAVLSHCILTKKVAKEDFVVAILKVTEKDGKRTAWLRFENGNGQTLAKQYFEYTDFPLDEISFYVEGIPGHKVMMLPNER